MTRPNLIDLNPNEPHFYSLMVSFNKCNESCKTLDYPSDTVCAINKSEIANLNVFNMITITNESKTLTKHTSS